MPPQSSQGLGSFGCWDPSSPWGSFLGELSTPEPPCAGWTSTVSKTGSQDTREIHLLLTNPQFLSLIPPPTCWVLLWDTRGGVSPSTTPSASQGGARKSSPPSPCPQHVMETLPKWAVAKEGSVPGLLHSCSPDLSVTLFFLPLSAPGSSRILFHIP